MDAILLSHKDLAQEAIRLRDRVERLRGLCKTATGYLHDAGMDVEANAIYELIGDMEQPL